MIRYVSRLEPLRIELIAPAHHAVESGFTDAVRNFSSYRRRLTQLQQFRGQVYVREGFLRPADLDGQGRHYSAMDRNRWHLLITDPQDKIKACASMRLYDLAPEIEGLTVHEIIRRSTGNRLDQYQQALRRLMEQTRRDGMRFGEVGGWAVDPDVRNGAATITTILSSWSLQRLLGGECVIVATVGRGKKADRILSRMGGYPLSNADGRLPRFFDAGYNSEIDILTFDSRRPCPASVHAIDELCHRLMRCRIYAPEVGDYANAHMLPRVFAGQQPGHYLSTLSMA